MVTKEDRSPEHIQAAKKLIAISSVLIFVIVTKARISSGGGVGFISLGEPVYAVWLAFSLFIFYLYKVTIYYYRESRISHRKKREALAENLISNRINLLEKDYIERFHEANGYSVGDTFQRNGISRELCIQRDPAQHDEILKAGSYDFRIVGVPIVSVSDSYLEEPPEAFEDSYILDQTPIDVGELPKDVKNLKSKFNLQAWFSPEYVEWLSPFLFAFFALSAFGYFCIGDKAWLYPQAVEKVSSAAGVVDAQQGLTRAAQACFNIYQR